MSKFNTIELEFKTMTPPVSDESLYTQICDPDTGEVIGDNMTQAWKLYNLFVPSPLDLLLEMHPTV